MAVCQEQKQNFIVKLLPQENQPSKHQSIIIRMSYVLLSILSMVLFTATIEHVEVLCTILLYIIDQINPKPLHNPRKNQKKKQEKPRAFLRPLCLVYCCPVRDWLG